MKSKSPANSQPQAQCSSFETPKKKISSVVDGSCRKSSDDDLRTPKNKRRSSTKKSQRKRRSSESDEEKIDKKTEENIQQVALKNNLTEDAVKKILKKVVGNDHVLAIVKLQEEEMDRNNLSFELTDDDDDEEDNDDVKHAPKITRSLAKVLNKKILPITAPSEPSEASILIQEELGSDDEDEEYEPGNDAHSDDDHNSSISDVDSQPRTPRTPCAAGEDTPTKYTNDGVFKIPRDRNDSSTSQNDQDYIIAKRTRSKVSLATTAIETIESTFQPPDIPPDMYDGDNELDTDWLEFLNVLTKPINQTVEDDDETDPEYVAVADKIPIDKEELREVNISKKELSDLVDELFSNLSDVDFDEINKYDIYPELFRTKQKSSKSDNNQELNRSDVQSNADVHPSEISTPVSSKYKSIGKTLSGTENVTQSAISILSNLTENQSTLLKTENQTPTLVTVNAVNPFQGATFVDGIVQVPQMQHILIQIPTIDILKIQAQQQQQQQQQQQHECEINALGANSPFLHENLAGRANLYQQKLFRNLKNESSVVAPLDATHEGFTQYQRNILDQQLRMHVQFAAQNYLQVYGNPGNDLWKEAPKYKSFLTELDAITNGTSIKIENLQPALNVMSKWEEDLTQPDTDENKDYVEFLYDELIKSQKSKQTRTSYIPKFSKRMMDVVVHSVAFPYPHLLPKIPFRMDSTGKTFLSEFIPMEDYLLAFHLEQIEDEYSRERTRNRIGAQRNKISLKRKCDRICSRLCPFRLSDSKNAVCRYVVRRKSKSPVYNPIQYYFEHNKAPPFKHNLIKFDRNNQLAPKEHPVDQLPYSWGVHIQQLLTKLKHSKLQHKHSKPIQRVLPQVRSIKVEKSNVIDRQSAQTTTTTTTHVADNSPVKTTKQPIFVVRSENDSNDGTVPIQYEILEIDSDQFASVYGPNNSTDKSTVKPVSECTNGVIELRKRSAKEKRKILGKRLPKDPEKSVPTQKLSQIIGWLHGNHFKLNSNKSKNLLAVHTSVRSFSIYMIFLQFELEMESFFKLLGKDKGDELKNKSKLVEDVVEPPDCNIVPGIATVNASTRKNTKTQRTDNTRLMLLPETKEDINEKDLVYAQNFMDKVEEVYAAENKTEKVTEFLQILQTFNQVTDKVEELYYKMEQLFLPDHPELAELFLTFLLPGDAAQIGKFIEHFMLTNMNNFINKLNIYFNKQPAQIRKIMTCLRDLSNEDDLELEQVKMKIFPLLKGNPLLIEWFKQCFPSDTTSDCPAEEFESLSFYRAENAHQTDDENDVYENVNQSEILSDPVDNPCHIRYLNGRVYYGSRILLPAKLSFLVVTASDQNAINEVAKSDAIHLKPKDASADGNETDYRCVHSIKQYSDNKMRECQKNQLETPENTICEEVDNDKSTDELQNCSDATDDAEPQTSESCVQNDEKILSSSVESLDTSHNTCDDLTLKAHGIRLNPTVHQSNVIKSEDLLCLLDPIDDVAEKSSEESLKNSPKKRATRAHCKSPNTKKPTKRSPINNKKGQQGANVPTEDSNAIRTAKRLKRLIETDDSDEPVRLVKKSKPSKCTKSVADTNKNRKNKLSPSDELPATATAKTEQPNTSAAEPSTSSTPSTSPTTWSRDEDKLVLEQIKTGFTNEENLVQTLQTKLPNRSYSEIFERFTFLMDIIANL